MKGGARSLFVRLRDRLRDSPWYPLVGRAGSVVVALVVLAWIGRVATAAPPAPHEPTAASPAAGSAALVPPAAPLPPPCSPPAGAGPSRATPEDPVYLNHANAEELRRRPGAGPKRASAIVALRQRMGRFRRVEDLLRVKGVGRSTLRKWRPLLRLDAPPPAAADAGASE